MPRPAQDQTALHLKAIESLARETGHRLEVVREVYELELARLQAAAHITEYVVLLSSRRTREALGKPARTHRKEPAPA